MDRETTRAQLKNGFLIMRDNIMKKIINYKYMKINKKN